MCVCVCACVCVHVCVWCVFVWCVHVCLCWVWVLHMHAAVAMAGNGGIKTTQIVSRTSLLMSSPPLLPPLPSFLLPFPPSSFPPSSSPSFFLLLPHCYLEISLGTLLMPDGVTDGRGSQVISSSLVLRRSLSMSTYPSGCSVQ